MRAYDKLKEEYALKNGVDNARSSVESSAFKGVFTIDDFYRRYTGSDGAPIGWQEWLYTDSFFLPKQPTVKCSATTWASLPKSATRFCTVCPKTCESRKSVRAL